MCIRDRSDDDHQSGNRLRTHGGEQGGDHGGFLYPEMCIRDRLIASEHDVSFLGAQRKQQRAKGFKQLLLKRDCRLLKKEELEALHYCSIVMPQNEKDKMLLVEHGIKAECIFVLTPFYHNMEYIVRSDVNYDILFWGAMYREENYQAALWFIRQVMPLLADTNIRFVVAGNRPPQELIDCQSERIIITGLVEDETSYFEDVYKRQP